jgi:LacI family transcriptional regulator
MDVTTECIMAATLTAVAKEAGVSLATASRAFRASDLLASETRRRVLDAAGRIGYVVPPAFRTRRLAVVVPDISNAVYAALTEAIQESAWPGRHRMLLASTGEDPMRELECMKTCSAEADGVILCSPRSSAASAYGAAGRVPLVVINGESPAASVPSVLLDVSQGLAQAIEHLRSLGHRKIVYVPGPPASWANSTRQRILHQLARRHGLELSTVGHQEANVQGGLAAAAAVVATGATAAIAYNDLVGLGIQAGVRRLGMSCPADLSVIGIDDLDVAATMGTGLTTVRTEITKSAALSLELLLGVIDGTVPASARPLRLGSQLIVRGSTALAPAGRAVPPASERATA